MCWSFECERKQLQVFLILITTASYQLSNIYKYLNSRILMTHQYFKFNLSLRTLTGPIHDFIQRFHLHKVILTYEPLFVNSPYYKFTLFSVT